MYIQYFENLSCMWRQVQVYECEIQPTLCILLKLIITQAHCCTRIPSCTHMYYVTCMVCTCLSLSLSSSLQPPPLLQLSYKHAVWTYIYCMCVYTVLYTCRSANSTHEYLFNVTTWRDQLHILLHVCECIQTNNRNMYTHMVCNHNNCIYKFISSALQCSVNMLSMKADVFLSLYMPLYGFTHQYTAQHVCA